MSNPTADQPDPMKRVAEVVSGMLYELETQHELDKAEAGVDGLISAEEFWEQFARWTLNMLWMDGYESGLQAGMKAAKAGKELHQREPVTPPLMTARVQASLFEEPPDEG